MALESKPLRYFVQVAHHGSLSQAARSLNMVQPALSHHIGNLERELGVELFARKAHGVVLTEAGSALLPYALSALRLLDEAQTDITAASRKVSGTVRVGFSGAAGIVAIPRLMKAVRERYPDVILEVTENYSAALVEGVRGGRLDMAVSVSTTGAGGAGRETIPIVREPMFLVGSPATLSGAARNIPFTEIFDGPLVLTAPGNSVRMMIERLATEHNCTVEPIAEVSGLAALKATVTAGVANTVLSYCAVVREVERGELIARRIVKPALQRTIVLDYQKHTPGRRAEDEIRALIPTLFAELVADKTIPGKLLFDPDRG